MKVSNNFTFLKEISFLFLFSFSIHIFFLILTFICYKSEFLIFNKILPHKKQQAASAQTLSPGVVLYAEPQTTVSTPNSSPDAKQKTAQKVVEKQAKKINNFFTMKKEDNSNREANQPKDSLKKRALTLADLFKDFAQTVQKSTNSSTGKNQLVVMQGDINHYSFLKDFLTHINNVFAFNKGPEKLQALNKQGKITSNAGLSIVINRKGKVLSATISKSFGSVEADELIIQAAQLASPFAPVSSAIKHETVRVELVSVVQ